MFETHQSFISPENENVKIWRYIDFTKFVSLLDTKSLYFTCINKFEDPFEGSTPKLNVVARDILPVDLPEGSINPHTCPK